MTFCFDSMLTRSLNNFYILLAKTIPRSVPLSHLLRETPKTGTFHGCKNNYQKHLDLDHGIPMPYSWLFKILNFILQFTPAANITIFVPPNIPSLPPVCLYLTCTSTSLLFMKFFSQSSHWQHMMLFTLKPYLLHRKQVGFG